MRRTPLQEEMAGFLSEAGLRSLKTASKRYRDVLEAVCGKTILTPANQHQFYDYVLNKRAIFMTKADLQAFTGRAEFYAKGRPTYPQELYTELFKFWHENNTNIDEPVIVDVGCGTGIATRAIYHAIAGRAKVYGVEPGHDMRKQAQVMTSESVTYIEASAERLPFPDNSADIITAAQAAQWFERPLFYAEAKRVLNKGGIIAIYENNRDWERSEFLLKHEEILEQYAHKKDGTPYSRYYRDFSYEKELKEIFAQTVVHTFAWNRIMTSEEFLLMAKSSTQVQRAIHNIGEQKVIELLAENINKHLTKEQNIIVNYITKLYLAKGKL